MRAMGMARSISDDRTTRSAVPACALRRRNMSDAVMVSVATTAILPITRGQKRSSLFHSAHTQNRPRHTDRADIVIGLHQIQTQTNKRDQNKFGAAPVRAPLSQRCTVEENFHFHRAAAARCCDFNSSAAQSLRGRRPHQPPPCRPYAADGC